MLSPEKRKCYGLKREAAWDSFPSARKQLYLLIIRLNLKPNLRGETRLVRDGLKRLCSLFERIDSGKVKIDIKDESGDVVSSKLN